MTRLRKSLEKVLGVLQKRVPDEIRRKRAGDRYARQRRQLCQRLASGRGRPLHSKTIFGKETVTVVLMPY